MPLEVTAHLYSSYLVNQFHTIMKGLFTFLFLIFCLPLQATESRFFSLTMMNQCSQDWYVYHATSLLTRFNPANDTTTASITNHTYDHLQQRGTMKPRSPWHIPAYRSAYSRIHYPVTEYDMKWNNISLQHSVGQQVTTFKAWVSTFAHQHQCTITLQKNCHEWIFKCYSTKE